VTKRKPKPTVVETTAERHQRIAEEAQHLLDMREWPDTIAQKLGYANAGNLATKLKAWGYVELGEKFQRVNFDGLVSNHTRTNYERRRGAAV
jgi:uncharacterized protein YdgA (DUF945 family)